MTADIYVLPVIKTEHDSPSEPFIVSLSRADMARLKRRAAQWNLSVVEAAAMLLSDALAPRRERPPGPLVDVDMAISIGLSMVVPGPPSLIGSRGSAVRLAKEALDRAGYKIIPK